MGLRKKVQNPRNCGLCIKQEHVLLAAIAFAIILFPLAAKPFIDTFAIGKSFAREYGFAVYLLLLAGTSFIAPMLNQHIPKNTWKAQVALIAFLFIYGFAGQMYFNAEIGSKAPNSIILALDQEGYTSTSFGHNHVLKTIFCPFGIDSENVDCARPVAKYFPAMYIDIARIIWALAGFMSLLAYVRLEKPGDKAAYAILSFAALRTAVDGGLLNFDLVTFCMLIAFHIARKNRVRETLVGLPVGFTIVTAMSLLLGFFPRVSNSIFPMLLVLYPICIFFENPRKFFPLLALTLLVPIMLVNDGMAQDRWAPEACQNAGVDYLLNETANGTMYTNCEASVSLACGNVSAGNGNVSYIGYKLKNTPLVISKALSQQCRFGVFSIENVSMTGEIDNN